MSRVYKYNPDDYRDMLGLADDLTEFYRLYEIYRTNQTEHNLLMLKIHWQNLFFTIKHREFEGFLTSTAASDIRQYLEDLVNDDL